MLWVTSGRKAASLGIRGACVARGAGDSGGGKVLHVPEGGRVSGGGGALGTVWGGHGSHGSEEGGWRECRGRVHRTRGDWPPSAAGQRGDGPRRGQRTLSPAGGLGPVPSLQSARCSLPAAKPWRGPGCQGASSETCSPVGGGDLSWVDSTAPCQGWGLGHCIPAGQVPWGGSRVRCGPLGTSGCPWVRDS